MTLRLKKCCAAAAVAGVTTMLAGGVNAAHETHPYGVANFGGPGE